jgi:hypothetical protein
VWQRVWEEEKEKGKEMGTELIACTRRQCREERVIVKTAIEARSMMK